MGVSQGEALQGEGEVSISGERTCLQKQAQEKGEHRLEALLDEESSAACC